jgi:hypothetical protein
VALSNNKTNQLKSCEFCDEKSHKSQDKPKEVFEEILRLPTTGEKSQSILQPFLEQDVIMS